MTPASPRSDTYPQDWTQRPGRKRSSVKRFEGRLWPSKLGMVFKRNRHNHHKTNTCPNSWPTTKSQSRTWSPSHQWNPQSETPRICSLTPAKQTSTGETVEQWASLVGSFPLSAPETKPTISAALQTLACAQFRRVYANDRFQIVKNACRDQSRSGNYHLYRGPFD